MAKKEEVKDEKKLKDGYQEVDKQAFVARKLAILNTKEGAMYERNASRVVANNK